MKTTTSIAIVLALASSLSARAALTCDFNDAGAIPLGGAGYSFSAEHLVSGTGVIDSGGVTLVLIFNDSTHLDGTILGSLTLNYSDYDLSKYYYATFTPTSSSVSGQQTYAVTFDVDFLGSSPNGYWGLNLWDTSAETCGIENGLVSWELQIDGASPVPEPITCALPLFGLIFIGGTAARCYLKRRHKREVRS